MADAGSIIIVSHSKAHTFKLVLHDSSEIALANAVTYSGISPHSLPGAIEDSYSGLSSLAKSTSPVILYSALAPPQLYRTAELRIPLLSGGSKRSHRVLVPAEHFAHRLDSLENAIMVLLGDQFVVFYVRRNRISATTTTISAADPEAQPVYIDAPPRFNIALPSGKPFRRSVMRIDAWQATVYAVRDNSILALVFV